MRWTSARQRAGSPRRLTPLNEIDAARPELRTSNSAVPAVDVSVPDATLYRSASERASSIIVSDRRGDVAGVDEVPGLVAGAVELHVACGSRFLRDVPEELPAEPSP